MVAVSSGTGGAPATMVVVSSGTGGSPAVLVAVATGSGGIRLCFSHLLSPIKLNYISSPFPNLTLRNFNCLGVRVKGIIAFNLIRRKYFNKIKELNLDLTRKKKFDPKLKESLNRNKKKSPSPDGRWVGLGS